MNLWEQELAIMDTLPRHEAYVSMLALGLGAGFVLAVLLNILVPVILSLLPYAPLGVALFICLLLTSPIQ